jgi:type I restriction enzyme M protein
MASNIDLPDSVKHFNKIFSKFYGQFYDYNIFADFIDYTIACLLFDGCEATSKRLQQHYGKHYNLFAELFKELITTYENGIKYSTWTDPLGDLYMGISSKSKKSGFGQFFTPPEICTMMAKMTIGENSTKYLKINDPACGSGRTLLAANSFLNECFVFGEDLDPLCTKMAAINLAIHGCQGQVCCMNSITQDWYFAFEINPYHRMEGFPPIPHICRISVDQCFAKLKEQNNQAKESKQLSFF